MMRYSVLRTAQLTTTRRAFSSAVKVMAEGDTGATRTGGARQGDAFTTREKANEDYYVKQQELKKLEGLKKKISEQQKHLQDLDQDLDKLIESTGKSSSKK